MHFVDVIIIHICLIIPLAVTLYTLFRKHTQSTAEETFVIMFNKVMMCTVCERLWLYTCLYVRVQTRKYWDICGSDIINEFDRDHMFCNWKMLPKNNIYIFIVILRTAVLLIKLMSGVYLSLRTRSRYNMYSKHGNNTKITLVHKYVD